MFTAQTAPADKLPEPHLETGEYFDKRTPWKPANAAHGSSGGQASKTCRVHNLYLAKTARWQPGPALLLPGLQHAQQAAGACWSFCFCPKKKATPTGNDWQPCIHHQTLPHLLSHRACTNCLLNRTMTDSPQCTFRSILNQRLHDTAKPPDTESPGSQ